MRKIVVFEDRNTDWELATFELGSNMSELNSRIIRFRDWMDFDQSYPSDEAKLSFLRDVVVIYLDHEMPPGPSGHVIFDRINELGFEGEFFGTSDNMENQKNYIETANYIGKSNFGRHLSQIVKELIEREKSELTIN